MTLRTHDPVATEAQYLSERYSRRSFVGKLTAVSLGLVGGIAYAQRAVAVAAPLESSFRTHCSGGYHAGGACPGACPGIWGQCWWSCCTNLCNQRFTQFCDCCVPGSNDIGKTSTVYCPVGYVFNCKQGSCTVDAC